MALPEGLGLAAFNALPVAVAEQALLACCSAPRWAAALAAQRPFASPAALYAAAAAELNEDDLDGALAGHPRIGERAEGLGGAWSRREQSAVTAAGSDTLTALHEGNAAYEQLFGYVYLVCATGKSVEELLTILRSRLGNDPVTERAVVRDQLVEINRIRLGGLVEGAP